MISSVWILSVSRLLSYRAIILAVIFSSFLAAGEVTPLWCESDILDLSAPVIFTPILQRLKRYPQPS